MKNKQHIRVCDFLYLHPVRDASLTGCKGILLFSFSTKRCIHFNKFNASPNGMRLTVIAYIFHITHSLIHSFTHSLIHSFTHSLIYEDLPKFF